MVKRVSKATVGKALKKDKTKIKNKNKLKSTIVVNVNSHNKKKTTTHKRENQKPIQQPSLPYVINAPSQPQTQPIIIYQQPLGQVNPIPQASQRLGPIGNPLGYSNLLGKPEKLDTEIQTEMVDIRTPQEAIQEIRNENDKIEKIHSFYKEKENELINEKIYYKNKLLDVERENALLSQNEREIEKQFDRIRRGDYEFVTSKEKEARPKTPKKHDISSPSFYISPPSISTPIENNFLSPEAVNYPENILEEHSSEMFGITMESQEPLHIVNPLFENNQSQDQLSFHTLNTPNTFNVSNTIESENQSNASQSVINDLTEEDKINALLENPLYLDKFQDEYIARTDKKGKLKLYYHSGKPILITRINSLYKKYIK